MTDQPSEVIKAEVFVGCNPFWPSELKACTSFMVQLSEGLQQMCLENPKGLDVTLTTGNLFRNYKTNCFKFGFIVENNNYFFYNIFIIFI